MSAKPKVFVGIDWSHSTHQICIVDPDGHVVAEYAVAHEADALAKLCDELVARAEGDREALRVAIETTHGIVVETLLERGIPVFALNPRQTDRFRDRFSMSGAKDDRRDARVLADALRTDVRAFRRLEPEAPSIVVLRAYSRMASELTEERTRLVHKVREELRRYFPQFLEIARDVGAPWVLELWLKVPTPAAAKRARRASVASVLKRHRIRRIDAKEVLARLRKRPMPVAAGTAEAAVAHIRQLVERLRLVTEQLRCCRQELAQRLEEIAGEADEGEDGRGFEQRDVAILLSLPGVGVTVAATLLAEAHLPLRERDYRALRALAGVAPVTLRSGKRHSVVRRRARHPRLEVAVYHMGRVAAQHDPASRARYRELRARGHSHGRAVRAVADRLLRILCAMLRDRTLFETRAAA